MNATAGEAIMHHNFYERWCENPFSHPDGRDSHPAYVERRHSCPVTRKLTREGIPGPMGTGRDSRSNGDEKGFSSQQAVDALSARAGVPPEKLAAQ